jgi:hypothetical protein
MDHVHLGGQSLPLGLVQKGEERNLGQERGVGGHGAGVCHPRCLAASDGSGGSASHRLARTTPLLREWRRR